MSRQSDLRWTLVTFIHNKKLTLEDAIQLVDDVEERTDAVTYANDQSENDQAYEELENMKNTVTHIWNQITDAHR